MFVPFSRHIRITIVSVSGVSPATPPPPAGERSSSLPHPLPHLMDALFVELESVARLLEQRAQGSLSARDQEDILHLITASSEFRARLELQQSPVQASIPGGHVSSPAQRPTLSVTLPGAIVSVSGVSPATPPPPAGERSSSLPHAPPHLMEPLFAELESVACLLEEQAQESLSAKDCKDILHLIRRSSEFCARLALQQSPTQTPSPDGHVSSPAQRPTLSASLPGARLRRPQRGGPKTKSYNQQHGRALSRLVAPGAGYDAEERYPHPHRLPGTRKAILDAISQWFETCTEQVRRIRNIVLKVRHSFSSE